MAHELEFTAASFLRIATLEARRGRDDPGQMFSTVNAVINDLKVLHKQRRDACAPLWKTDEQKARETYATFRAEIDNKQAEKKSALESSLQQVSARLSASLESGIFAWGLRHGPLVGKRQTYSVTPGPERYFPMKQLELNLKNAHRLSAPNRNRIVAQLRDSMEGKLPRYVLRTDIANFYDSIPIDTLLNALWDYGGLSKTSTQLITALLTEWQNLSSQPVGIPTGVGLSAYLGEVFARQIDSVLSGHPAVHFYGRYVDDIAIVTRSVAEQNDVEAELTRVASQLGLSLNANKTVKVVPNSASTDAFDLPSTFDFLGYSIGKRGGHVIVDMSRHTVDRYKERLKVSFDRWASTPLRTSGHEGLLLDRIRFLTGNTRLVNSKGRAVTGIYFNYPRLTGSAKALSALDKYLASLLDANSSTLSSSLAKRLGTASFVSGFANRTFHRFRQSDLERIVAVWHE